MYKYSKGINLVAGGEKHRVYVKKSPTGVGKGVKGHVMVNHPTENKGKWDTIDLTEKAGAKTVEEGKNATKKWHAENPYVSGTKSVKQYRGDENLPEAKNGMKKNCGCKHTRSKYKYQIGTQGAKATKSVKNKGEVLEDMYAQMGELTGNRPEKLLRSAVIVDKNTNKAIVRAKDSRNNKNVNVITGQNRDVNAFRNVSSVEEADKNPLLRVTPRGYYKLRPDWNFTKKDRDEYNGNIAHLQPISANGRKAPISKNTALHQTFNPEVRNPLYGTNKANASYGCVNIKPEDYKYAMKNLENNDTLAVFDSRRVNDRDLLSRYQAVTQKAKGASALSIPEGSAIVTANGGKNKQALMAYKKGNYKLLNKIIDDMPEDRVDKAQAGKQATKGKIIEGNVKKRPVKGTNKIFTEQSAHGYGGYGQEMTEDKAKKMYGLSLAEYIDAVNSGKIPKVTADLETARREAVSKGLTKFDYKGKSYLSGFEEESKPGDNKPEDKPKDDSSLKIEEEKDKGDENKNKDEKSKYKLGSVPSMAEMAARSALLSQGVENVPENYLKLGRYQYASQLPKTLQENALAEQAGRETARDIVGGDAGRYLAQAGSLSAARMKLNNEAVIQDTLARQDILNKNVDLGNVEAETNTGLKNQYAMQRAANRGAYNNQLIALGKTIDTTFDVAKEQENLKQADEQRMQILKDLGASGNYTWEDIGNAIRSLKAKPASTTSTTTTTPSSTTPASQKRGSKRLKTYKRK